MMPGNQQPMGFPGMQQQNYMPQQQYPGMQGNPMSVGNNMMPPGNPMMSGAMMGGGNQMMGNMPNNPMMQQQQPQQQMMGGGMFYPGQMNQMMGVNSYYYTMPGAPGQGNMQGFTPQMAKEFKEKQGKLAEAAARQQQKAMEQQQRKQQKLMEQQRRLMDEQRKKMEQEMKHRQFQEQQKKLKEFSTIGGRKNLNADTLIDSIIGKSTAPQRTVTTHTASIPQAQTMPSSVPPPQADTDDFGDFLGGPSTTTTTSSSSQPPQPTSQPATQPPVQSNGQQTVTAPAPPVPKQQPKKDLMSMMFECSDLSAPKEARSFHQRTSVKDVVVTTQATAHTFTASKSARHWATADDETLSDLFTLPKPQQPQPPQQQLPQHPQQQQQHPQQQPQQQQQQHQHQQQPQQQPQQSGLYPGSPPPSPGAYDRLAQLPPWATGQAPLPQVYTQVLEASLRDNQISTGVLYSILVRSGLPRELLGHLWNLCNKRSPGQLCPEELNLLLAMVAAAQNNQNVATLEVLNNCPQAPIPWLGQQDNTQQQPQQQQQQQQQQAGDSTGENIGLPQNEEDDDFADFQTASHPTTPAVQTSTPVATSLSSSSMGPPAGIPPIVVPDSFRNLAHPPAPSAPVVHEVGLSAPQEDKYAVFRAASEPPTTTDEDEFADFKGPPSPAATKKTAAPSSGFADFPGFRESLPDTSSSSSGGGFADFSSAPSQWSDTGSTPGKIEAGKFEAGKSETKDDFADFQSHDVPAQPSSSAADDKYAAIKAMIMDKSKFSAVPVVKETDAGILSSEDDWGNAISPSEDTSQSHSSSESTNKFDTFVPSSDVDATSSSSDLFSSSHTNDNDNDDDWANFETAGPTPVASQIDWSSGFQADDKPKEKEKEKSPAPTKPDSLKVDPKKAYGMFSRNMDPPQSNFSALDTEPPDFPPEMPDDDDDDDGFDKFGTFQSSGGFGGGFESSGSGMSSLVTPYGGLEDFGGAGSNNLPISTHSSSTSLKSSNTDLPTPVSLPSIDYNEWKTGNGGLDSQSMKSLELKVGKDGSVDSQSVSSLDLAASDSRKNTPQDARSIASLELKASTSSGVVSERTTPTVEDSGGSGGGGGVFGGTGGERDADTGEGFGGGQYNSSGMGLHGSRSDTNSISSPPPLDMKEMLTKGELPNLGDRYSGLTKEPQDSERHAYEWQRCLSKCQEMICAANNTFNSITSREVLDEVLDSHRGRDYVKGVVEIYRLVCRIRTAMKAVSISNGQLEECVAEAGLAWGNLAVFIADTPLMPESSVLDFSRCVVSGGEGSAAAGAACGVCLLDVHGQSRGGENNGGGSGSGGMHRLTYGGRQYHAACANFWVNCVDSTLPALRIPELL